jgi:hypothetical protein
MNSLNEDQDIYSQIDWKNMYLCIWFRFFLHLGF